MKEGNNIRSGQEFKYYRMPQSIGSEGLQADHDINEEDQNL